jgi:hypothetical protein
MKKKEMGQSQEEEKMMMYLVGSKPLKTVMMNSRGVH